MERVSRLCTRTPATALDDCDEIYSIFNSPYHEDHVPYHSSRSGLQLSTSCNCDPKQYPALPRKTKLTIFIKLLAFPTNFRVNTDELEPGPKLSKRALTAAKFQERSAAKNEPQTVEDYLEEGAVDEESGDRWHSSDLAKGLRFYQKSYENYRHAIQSGVADQQDSIELAYYNASRLLFHVYMQYQRTDGVNLSELTNVAEVLGAGDDSVVQEIRDIIRSHESAIQFTGTDAPTDLLFNTALAYMDAIEESESSSETYELASRSIVLLKQVLSKQASDLREVVGKSANSDEIDLDTVSLVATDVVETVNSVLNLAQIVYESVGTSEEEIAAVSSLIGAFVFEADSMAKEILTGSLQISDELKNEYSVTKAYASAASSNNLDKIVEIWDDPSLPSSPERYMSAADCIDSFMQRSGISSNSTAAPDLYWAALSKMNQYFKMAQESLSERLAAAKSGPQASQQMGIGGIISQVAKVQIARSDIDLQRSQLQTEQAIKNSELLLRNSRAFLKNAMAVAKQSGGIREKAVEKAQREKRRIEAACRLCVLEGKSSEAELDAIVGAGRWSVEIDGYRDLWYIPFN